MCVVFPRTTPSYSSLLVPCPMASGLTLLPSVTTSHGLDPGGENGVNRACIGGEWKMALNLGSVCTVLQLDFLWPLMLFCSN